MGCIRPYYAPLVAREQEVEPAYAVVLVLPVDPKSVLYALLGMPYHLWGCAVGPEVEKQFHVGILRRGGLPGVVRVELSPLLPVVTLHPEVY